jgi:hypothetical protein
MHALGGLMNDMAQSQPLTNPVLFLGLFSTVWCAVCVVMATIGGWRRLAESYRAIDEFDGERWRFRSARMGWVGYNNCLTFGVNATGLYLAVLFPFRLGHPPLLIPWSEIDVSEQKTWVGFKYCEFRFRQAPSVIVRIAGGLGTTLLRAAGHEGVHTWQVVG